VSYTRDGETVRLDLNPEINIPNERSPGYIHDFFYTGNLKYVRLGWQYFIVVEKNTHVNVHFRLHFYSRVLHLLQGRQTPSRTP